MPMTKIAVTIDEKDAVEIDRLVAAGHYPNRSKVIQEALKSILRDSKIRRLAAECAKLDPAEEQAMAEEFLGSDSWPEY
ncbi:ribbon-helix-helix domain-containing protein [bacterium]|nr:ribbon-helix-helix domain-containing protein [bacterium]